MTALAAYVDGVGLLAPGICDWPAGTMPWELPFTLGHETAGTVAALGPGASGVAEGDPVRVESRRGCIVVPARLTNRVDPGNVFIPFHFREAAANMLTVDALDPHGKIPEFKFCAVRLER